MLGDCIVLYKWILQLNKLNISHLFCIYISLFSKKYIHLCKLVLYITIPNPLHKDPLLSFVLTISTTRNSNFKRWKLRGRVLNKAANPNPLVLRRTKAESCLYTSCSSKRWINKEGADLDREAAPFLNINDFRCPVALNRMFAESVRNEGDKENMWSPHKKHRGDKH